MSQDILCCSSFQVRQGSFCVCCNQMYYNAIKCITMQGAHGLRGFEEKHPFLLTATAIEVMKRA